ncbi:hypothetical protein [Bacillus benzoevorans]|uniref:Uncharacterized protein n=1 Tax=Bacillus benzoevorans TaxID=1456 RepID=A0A7X0HNS2_9BACI|nr:hypothetical protein [Bacillus benzoevorans]MBB6444154.1 hypothetical protein [Bacillus benzoevorans]
MEEKQFEQENQNVNPLAALALLPSFLSKAEEATFMNVLYSSSARVRRDNFGLSRKEVEKQLGIEKNDHEFESFLARVNQAIGRYFQLIYDETRDQVVVMMRTTARRARGVLPKEAMAILMYIFYEQEVLQHPYTLFSQLLEAFGHESFQANRKIQSNIDILMKIGAVDHYSSVSSEEAYRLTAIGKHMFSDSFLRRFTEFSQSTQLNMDDVLKFYKRYNLEGRLNDDSLEA